MKNHSVHSVELVKVQISFKGALQRIQGHALGFWEVQVPHRGHPCGAESVFPAVLVFLYGQKGVGILFRVRFRGGFHFRFWWWKGYGIRIALKELAAG